MESVGRFLEALGVVLAPLSLIVGLVTGSGRQELLMLAAAAAIFLVGHRLAGSREG